METRKVLDTEYAYQIAGSGPPLLLVHGFPLDHCMWQQQLPVLSEQFQVLAVDLRGFGCSQRGSASVSMKQFARDLAELTSQLFGATPFCFCGLSMGGYIGWEFLRMNSERLSRIILCDTRADCDDERTARARRWMAEAALATGMDEVVRTMAPRLVGATTCQRQPQVLTKVQDWIGAAAPTAYAAGQQAMADRADSNHLLPQIAIPALVVVGAEDAITPPEEMKSMADRIPNARFALIPQSGHLPPLEQPAVFNQVLIDFLIETNQVK